MTRRKFASNIDRGAGDHSTSWTALTLAASWANVTGYATAAYSQDNQGVVYLKGTIDSGTKTKGTTVTTLPAGARPGAKLSFPVVADDGTTPTPFTVEVGTDGTVKLGPGKDFLASSNFSLNGIVFPAAG